MLQLYDLVEIVRINAPKGHHGSPQASRAPRIGDHGTIVFIMSDPDEMYSVECVNPEGLTVWLADFHATELRMLTEPS